MSISLLLGFLALDDVVQALAPSTSNPTISRPGYVLPQFDPNPLQRAQEVTVNHAGFLYGPPLIGNSSFFPAGTLGGQRVKADVVAFTKGAAFITQAIEKESPTVVQKVTQVPSIR